MPQNWVRKAPKAQSLSDYVLKCWSHCQRALAHDYAIAGWMLSPCPELQHQVKKRMDGEDKISCNNLLAKLFVPQTLSPEETYEFLPRLRMNFGVNFILLMNAVGKYLVLNCVSGCQMTSQITRAMSGIRSIRFEKPSG